jgi:hypothetical protein
VIIPIDLLNGRVMSRHHRTPKSFTINADMRAPGVPNFR